jgi:hypothetical protein
MDYSEPVDPTAFYKNVLRPAPYPPSQTGTHP